MEKTSIKFFDKFLFRIPIYPINFLEYIDNFEFIINIESFKEAIFLASADLYEDIYIKKNISEKVKNSLLKYFIRACTRSTPYGIFAGCNLGTFSDDSKIEVNELEQHQTYLRIDMDFLCSIIRILESDSNIRNKLKYHVNSSLYNISSCYRYVEFTVSENKRKYFFSEVKSSEYLKTILNSLFERPQTITELASQIISTEISFDEAREFIIELIDEQILISELEPSVVGDDLIFQLQKKLNQIDFQFPILDNLIQSLKEINNLPIGKRIEYYNNLKLSLKNQLNINSKNFFHIDLKISSKKATISSDIMKTILEGVNVLNRISTYNEGETLKKFKKAFYERFEEQEIPLTLALDIQNGIGIGDWSELKGDMNPLVDDLLVTRQGDENSSVHFGNLQRLLSYKYDNYLSENLEIIEITEEDLNLFPIRNEDDLSDQMYTKINILKYNPKHNESLIYMDSVAPNCASNLLSRFSYLDNNINSLINKINKNQEEFYPDKIIAEILHLPEDRIGNIQMHRNNRKFGIPYISNPFYEDTKLEMIMINDIMISVPNRQKIILRSKKHNKEIMPQLTTAHNFLKGLPIYFFLSLIQQQNQKFLNFEWGSFFENKRHLPRVQYKNIVLSYAKWKFGLSDFPAQENKNFNDYYKDILDWKSKNKIPDLVQIVENDNKLLIDFNNKEFIKILIKQINTRKFIYIEEFLFYPDQNNLVKKNENVFTNELIMFLHKS